MQPYDAERQAEIDAELWKQAIRDAAKWAASKPKPHARFVGGPIHPSGFAAIDREMYNNPGPDWRTKPSLSAEERYELELRRWEDPDMAQRRWRRTGLPYETVRIPMSYWKSRGRRRLIGDLKRLGRNVSWLLTLSAAILKASRSRSRIPHG